MRMSQLKKIIKEIVYEEKKQKSFDFPDWDNKVPDKPDGHRKRIWDKTRKPKKVITDYEPRKKDEPNPHIYRKKK